MIRLDQRYKLSAKSLRRCASVRDGHLRLFSLTVSVRIAKATLMSVIAWGLPFSVAPSVLAEDVPTAEQIQFFESNTIIKTIGYSGHGFNSYGIVMACCVKL